MATTADSIAVRPSWLNLEPRSRQIPALSLRSVVPWGKRALTGYPIGAHRGM